jgi:hypothetical protein
VYLGKDKHGILFLVFLLSSSYVFGQAGTYYKYRFEGDSASSEIIQGNQSLSINYSVSELNILSVINDYGSFYRISVPGHISSSIPGKPEVPILCRLLNLSPGQEYKVSISDVRTVRIKPSQMKFKGKLYPAQMGETKVASQLKSDFSLDRNVYATKGMIASDTVWIERIGTMRNKQLATLYISPVRYDPGRNIIDVITSMKIEITSSSRGAAKSKNGLSETALSARALDKSLLDYDLGGVVPGYSTQPVKMVIITDTIFRKQLLPYFKWKTQKGFILNILYKGAGLAGNTYAQLKDTLNKIYYSATPDDPAPEYLLIIGDINKIPTSDETTNISDMYYGEFDGGGDYIPDMYIGRLPVSDTSDVKSVVSKIIQYEKFEFADTNTFYNRALISAGNDPTYQLNMNGQLHYVLGNYLNSSNHIDEFHFYYPESTNIYVEDSIKKIFRNGISFVNYTGHGDATGWLDPVLKNKDVDSLKNKNMYPFVITNACRTSQYSSPTSLGNRMVLTKDKGAIGYIGCSNDSYWDEDYFWAIGAGTVSLDPTYQTTGLGSYDRLFHTHGESPSDWYYTMGQINYAGNLAVSASTSTRKKYYWETYNLVGDPTMIPIIGKPGTFSIAVPDTLPNGIKSITMNADPFSYLALSHADTLWDASNASASGSVELTMPGISNDSCLMVITGQNKMPVIKTIRIADIKSEYINLTANSINDSQGNNNQKADFGESFFLSLTISNLGKTDATGLYAKISTTSDLLTINKDSVYIGTLKAKSEKKLTSDLAMTVSGNIPDLAIITIDLLLKDSKGIKHYKIDICVHAPDLAISNCVVNDSIAGNKNNVADPGETCYLVFKVTNQGSSSISGQLHVTSNSASLTILEPVVGSGVLNYGETTDIPVRVKISESASIGTFISVSCLLDCTPYVLNKDFTFRIGKVRESFESMNFKVFPWINVSPVPWTITDREAYDGVASARSGLITHNQSTSLIIRTIYENSDSVRFHYKVSSEANYDNLVFKLNDAVIMTLSGELPWTRTAVPVEPGMNKMEWTYSKDQSVSNGLDGAWIDLIDFAASNPVSYIEKDLQVARIVTPYQKNKLGQETVTLKLLNLGKDTINSFNLAYRVNDMGSPVMQTFNSKIVPYGDSVTVSFDTKTDLSRYGDYTLLAYAYDNNDDYLHNDSLMVQLENNQLKDSLSAYPNPFVDQLSIYVQTGSYDNLKVSVINSSGAVLYETEKEVLPGINTLHLTDLSLAASVYYIRIKGVVIDTTIPVVKLRK